MPYFFCFFLIAITCDYNYAITRLHDYIFVKSITDSMITLTTTYDYIFPYNFTLKKFQKGTNCSVFFSYIM
jgi:hypothetical protein